MTDTKMDEFEKTYTIEHQLDIVDYVNMYDNFKNKHKLLVDKYHYIVRAESRGYIFYYHFSKLDSPHRVGEVAVENILNDYYVFKICIYSKVGVK